MNFDQSPIATCIAVNFDREFDPKAALYEMAMEVFRCVDLTPNKMGGARSSVVRFSEAKVNPQDVSLYNYSREIKKVEREADWMANFECRTHRRFETSDLYMFFGAIIPGWNTSRWITAFVRFLEAFDGMPSYAYVFERELRFAPSVYATGYVVKADGSPPKKRGVWPEDYEEMFGWQNGLSHGMNRKRLRSIYTDQIFDKAVLKANVGDVTLAQWIASASKRGMLGDFSECLVRWSIPPEHVEEVKIALRGTEVLVPAHRSGQPWP